MLASHVDDIIRDGTSEFESKVIYLVRAKLSVVKEDSQIFQYVGIEIADDEQIYS